MRDRNGIEIARRVRHSYPQIKVIILTTYDDESYLHQALEAGVHGFLLKSVSHETLPDAIRAVMGGERLLSPSLISAMVSNYLLIPALGSTSSGITIVAVTMISTFRLL